MLIGLISLILGNGGMIDVSDCSVWSFGEFQDAIGQKKSLGGLISVQWPRMQHGGTRIRLAESMLASA